MNYGLIFQLEGQVVAILVQSLDRLDESVKEESDGVHNTLGRLSRCSQSFIKFKFRLTFFKVGVMS